MKIPAFVVVIGLVVIGFVVLRSIVSTLKFSAKLMTWGIILILGTSAAMFLMQGNKNDPSRLNEVHFRTQSDDLNYQ